MERKRRHLSCWLAACLAAAVLGAGAGVAGCKPDLGDPQSLVTAPRLLAVRGDPAEAAPDTPVTYRALAAGASGTIAAPALTWSLCDQPKPPAEANAVNTGCVDLPDQAGPSPTFTAPMPARACTLFGPIAPDVMAGQPPIRPRDPDVTGGFYQPLRVTLSSDGGGDVAFELERIRCDLANVPIDVTAAFNMQYLPNVNPTLARITLDPDGQPNDLFTAGAPPPASPGLVGAGARVTLEAAWPDDAPESYPVWNIAARTLETQRESLRVSWFATGGSFDHDRTGRGEDEPETFTRDVWTAPAQAGPVHLWVVLRDSRGGVDFATAELQVEP